jgi:hypothetical protein
MHVPRQRPLSRSAAIASPSTAARSAGSKKSNIGFPRHASIDAIPISSRAAALMYSTRPSGSEIAMKFQLRPTSDAYISRAWSAE